MISNRIYYRVKPYLPLQLRMGARRVVARTQRRMHMGTWPINEAAGRMPVNWPGWPQGRKFAFVLTHDVEGPLGLAKCRQLMQLEKELGFRSSFNFIPEGDYTVSRELREELKQNGFEVGVHDLYHDGNLYESRPVFSEKAKRINHYLTEWEASGFRSGFMMHNLDWLHDLNAGYDASTFDTDPFEPQPDGVGTIFPFWVPAPAPAPAGRGYVEMPYTLPQDSTLFLLLKETSADIWKRKLDWIAEHGGMALVNVHPDCLAFGPVRSASQEFPVDFYREFLEYARAEYRDLFWQPLPRELAGYVSGFRPLRRPTAPRKICMVSYSDYQTDNRVIRYAEALAERGDTVDVLGIKSDSRLADVETMDQVRVHRLQERYGKKEKNKGEHLLPLLKFWLRACGYLMRRQFSKRYDLIHVHNIPDFLVFAAWLPKMAGAKIILDIHDLVPEFYASKFKLKPGSPEVAALKQVERISARFANHVIISNHLWYKTFVARSVAPQKCSVFINNVNQRLFYRRHQGAPHSFPVIMFPGGLQWHQGLDIAIRAMAGVVKKIPAAEFHIYGSGNMKDDLVELTRSLGLAETVRFFDPLPVSLIAEAMSKADVGVVPKRADSFGNEAYSTKIMEFMSLGVPMVVANTKIDRFYFNDVVVRFFESGNADALAAALVEVLQDEILRQRMVASALEYAAQNSWNVRKNDYLELVDSLIENRPVRLGGNKPGIQSGVENGWVNQVVEVADEAERPAIK
jgi:glycosyltransferase involved in cell wall biosynthesis